MPVTISDDISRVLSTGRNPTAEHEYTVQGTSDEVEARTQLALHAPSAVDPYGTGLVFIPRETVTVEALSDNAWHGVVRYGYTAPESDEPSESFDTTGGQEHITQSKQTIGAYNLESDENDAPGYGGAIGVTSDNNVEGLDRVSPAYQFALKHFFTDEQVTIAYRRVLFQLTGKVNNTSFKICAAGECLFLGASGTRNVSTGKWEITFRFAGSANIDGTVEDPGIVIQGIEVPSKKGWEYLWIQYINIEDSAAKALGKRPVAVYVEKIYEDGDFSTLGIGT